MENMQNVDVVAAPVTKVAEKKSRLRPAVQSRLGLTLDTVKEVLKDGKPRGVSEITRGCEALGLASVSTWTDVMTVLKKNPNIFGACFVDGAKRQRYFMEVTTPASQDMVQTVQETQEVEAPCYPTDAPPEEPTLGLESLPEAPAKAPKKGKRKAVAEAPVQSTEIEAQAA